MKHQSQIDLPDLSKYRQEFTNQGVQTPLSMVPFSSRGLLAELPPPPTGKVGWPWTVEIQPPAEMMANGLAWPKVSIVTPSYNQGAFIEETIRSVLLQNYPNLEYVICDGGSNDETVEILEKYSPWLSFWQSKKDRGQGHAINLGFSLCSGNYFGWINSDDFYLPNCFETVVIYCSNHSPDFVYGDAIILYESLKKISYWQGYLVLDRYLHFGGLIASHAAFWKSDIHVPIWEEMKCNVDGELWFRLIAGKSRSHIRVPLGLCRIQPEAKTVNERYRPLWQEDNLKIWPVHGYPPKPRSFLICEHRLVQSIYHFVTKRISNNNRCSIINHCCLPYVAL